jgi:cystathionine beta-lyase/cystathionine gamma-synthase
MFRGTLVAGHKEPKRLDTRFVHGGSHPERFDGAVNPPVFRVSTVVSLHIGLEDPIDLIADLDQAMAAMTSASVER